MDQDNTSQDNNVAELVSMALEAQNSNSTNGDIPSGVVVTQDGDHVNLNEQSGKTSK